MPSVTIDAEYSGGTIATGTSYPPSTEQGTYDDDTDDHVDRTHSTGDHDAGIAVVRFNTGAQIPDDATITAAVLKLSRSLLVHQTGGMSLFGEWYNPLFAGGEGLVTFADFTNTPVGDAFQVLFTATVSGYNSFTLSNPATNVSKTGKTAFRIHMSPGAEVTDAVNVWGWSSAIGLAPPQLEVTYDLAMQDIRPDADIVTTGWSTAPLWSKIDEDAADGVVISATSS